MPGEKVAPDEIARQRKLKSSSSFPPFPLSSADSILPPAREEMQRPHAAPTYESRGAKAAWENGKSGEETGEKDEMWEACGQTQGRRDE